MTFIDEYSSHCIYNQMLLDGIEVMFIHLAFKQDILQESRSLTGGCNLMLVATRVRPLLFM